MNLWSLFKEVIKSGFYSIYQKQLKRKSHEWKIPTHIGIILDGNRRFARENKLANLALGHFKGADKLEEVLNWCDELGVKVVSIWVFSIDNFNRDADEVDDILGVIEKKMRSLINRDNVHSNKIKVRSMGKIELLPPSLQEAIHDAEEATKDYDKFILNVAVAYGGREEIIESIKQHLQNEAKAGKTLEEVAANLTTDQITQNLYTSDLPDPDLIIRTSGEIRLSGFLLWQSAYSEYYFCETNWPAFRNIDFLRAIREYSTRQRRFGK